jgi:hypothetical protein
MKKRMKGRMGWGMSTMRRRRVRRRSWGGGGVAQGGGGEERTASANPALKKWGKLKMTPIFG